MRERLHMMWSRLSAVFRKERLECQFEEELSTHLELLIDDYRRAGMSPAEARREAMRKLGHPESLRESHRDQRGIPVLEMLAQDLRYAVRMLRKSPGFTCIATFSVALGIGANTALFSLVDDLLLRSLPVRDPDLLVPVELLLENVPVSFPELSQEIQLHTQSVSAWIGFQGADSLPITIEGMAEPPRQVERVSRNYFRDGVTPILGRVPGPSNEAPAIISYGFWVARFGRSGDVLGRALAVDGQICPIIGVAL